MASQLEMLLGQEADFLVPGDAPSFGSIYSDMGAATQAASDWTRIITNGLGRVVDLEILKRYSPGSNQQPRIDGGQVAGSSGLNLAGAAPWIVGGLVVAGLLFVALRK